MKKNNIKKIAVNTAVWATIAVCGYSLYKEGSSVMKILVVANAETTTKTNNWTKEDFERLVSEYIMHNPSVNEEVARNYIALVYQEELRKNNPSLLYELTGIYEYEEMTTEKFNNLVSDTFTKLRSKGLNLKVEDVTKFVAIINIDQLAQDNKELLATICGNQDASEIITDAFKVTGSIKNVNYDIYQKNKSTKDLIKVSEFVFDKKAKADLELIESYVDEANAYKGNGQQQDNVISRLMADIQMPNGELTDMEDGIGFASTVAFDELINYISFNEKNVRVISKLNLSALMNHDTLELYLSNIYGNINKCHKTLSK